MIVETPKLGTVTLGTHFFKVKYHSMSLAGVLLRFCLKYVVYKVQSDEVNEVFGIRNSKLCEYRFHISQYEDFLRHLEMNQINIKALEVVVKPRFEPKKINLKIKDTYVLRDYQESCSDFFLMDEPGDFNSRMTNLPPGMGKGITAISTVVKAGVRTAIVVLPTFQEKWAAEVVQYTGVNPKRVMVVKGSKFLKAAVSAGKDDNLDVDFIVMSLSTLQNYYKEFQSGNDEGYEIHPEDMFEALGVGIVISDETHMHLFSVYRMLTYMHVNKLIALTATFIDDDKRIADMQQRMFPRTIRFDEVKPKKYTKAFAVSYNISQKHKYQIKTTERGSNMYSHGAFEKSIMQNPNIRSKYFDIVKDLVDVGYIQDRKDGDKFLIFVQSIKMATHLTEFLQKTYPHLNIKRYVEDDPYENVIEPDGRVTTIGSAGTGIDIPLLRTTVMTTNVSSSKSNIQALGRLRELKDRDTKFYYLYSNDIPKQREYHEKKKELFADRVLSLKELRAEIMI